MRIAYFDPFSGAAGDMILGAFLDAGLSLADLQTGLKALDLDGYDLEATKINQHGLTGTQFNVVVGPNQPQRDWSTIKPLIADSRLPATVRDRALAIFLRLAEAEAQVHGTSVDQVHFHEVGAVDAIVDICGCALAIDLMSIDEVYSKPPVLGSGWVRAQHGLMPVPAPATAALLASANAPLGRALPEDSTINAELLTPTGAAILTTLARFEEPAFAPSTIGYGFGRKQLPWPNALRLWIGDPT